MVLLWGDVWEEGKGRRDVRLGRINERKEDVIMEEGR